MAAGYIEVQLIGRRQKQSLDRLYYTCLDFVCAHGCSLSKYYMVYLQISKMGYGVNLSFCPQTLEGIRNNIVASSLINCILLRKRTFQEFKSSEYTVERIAKDLRTLQDLSRMDRENFIRIHSIVTIDNLCKYFIQFEAQPTDILSLD